MQTYTFDGRAWTKRGTDATIEPPGRMNASMARDDARGTVVLFGGESPLNDTWTWNGQAWARQYPADSPSLRGGAAATYDAAHQRVVIFGGGNGNRLFNETWTWDGTNWTAHGAVATATPYPQVGCPEPLAPSQVPSPRADTAMAYDAARGVIVLFGGTGGPAGLCDTWTWNGKTWTEQHPATVPPPRYAASMTYDPVHRNVVMFGGSQPARDDTWIWDGKDWHERHPAHSPQGRTMAGMDYNPRLGKVVLVGGWGVTGFNETWTWDGTDWTALRLATAPPIAPMSGLAFDAASGTMLFYGSARGTPDIWIFDGSTWRQLDKPQDISLPMSFAGLAYDAGNKVVVLFGGDSGNATWTWDGGSWTQQQPAVSPPGRGMPPLASPGSRASMAYDAARGVIVLFGGVGNREGLSDTWTWDGVTWVQQS